MKPFDPRLWRRARSARRWVVASAALGVASTALIAVQAALVARVVARAPALWWLAALAGCFAGRAVIAGIQERFGRRSARGVIGELRALLLHRAGEQGPRDGERKSTELVVLATRGLDALVPYFEGYLPSLVLAAILTPALLVLTWVADGAAGLIVAATLPLIPLFMILIGRFTERDTARQLVGLQRLEAQLLDLVSGLTTLRLLGRAEAPITHLRTLGERHLATTMRTLRRAFLSSFALELITTLSVASVAVSVGLRLLDGRTSLETGLFVILLAGEVYWPLRQVGAQFHAAADGASAAQQALDVLEKPMPARGVVPCPSLREATIELRGVSVGVAPQQFSLVVEPATTAPIVGPSGCGKSTAIEVMLGLVRPDEGEVLVGGIPVSQIEPRSFWQQVAWLPQRPSVAPGSVWDNVVRGRAIAREAVLEAARATGFDAVVATLPDGWETRIGRGGFGLSAGQRQRLALTRVLAGDEPLVVLDEPTAHLEAGFQLAPLVGRTVVVVTHRPEHAAAIHPERSPEGAKSKDDVRQPPIRPHPSTPGLRPYAQDER